jgi:GTPase SAR1 and related small G proteins
MVEKDYDYMFKIIIIGESGTGKSCILHYLLENRFKKNPNHTVGVEFGSKHMEISGKQIKLQI